VVSPSPAAGDDGGDASAVEHRRGSARPRQGPGGLVARWRRERRRLVFLTGAGLSARAGLGTFRGEDGIWARHPDLEAAMHHDHLPDSLPLLWQVWGGMARLAQEHGPTPGHWAIARMGASVITQNVDGLHQAARTEDVAELHGSARRAACLDPKCVWQVATTAGDGDRAQDHGVPESCPWCGSPTRPDVVLFDEQLPSAALDRAITLAVHADVFVAVGTSGTVFPAAHLVPLAKRHGARTVLIDTDPPLDAIHGHLYDRVIARDAHEVLPEWERRDRGMDGNPFLRPF
jgi:NAD-dependent deacetylase